MAVRWNSQTKLVEFSMGWEEARDFAQWLIAEASGDGDKKWGKEILEEAKKGAGF